MIGQFTAKTTNSEKAIYFLSLMSCSINKLVSSSHVKILFFDFTSKNKIVLQEIVVVVVVVVVVGGGVGYRVNI